MLGFLSHISERQPGALSASSAADSALLPLVAEARGGRNGWLPLLPSLYSPGLVPWECCLGQGHIEGTASVDLIAFPGSTVLPSVFLWAALDP